MYPRNAASPERILVGQVVAVADGAIQSTGVAITVRGQGGAEAASGGTIAYGADNSVYYTPTQAETNFTSFVVIASKASCFSASQTIITSASATSGKVVLSAETHIGAVIPTVSTLTGNTPQTGDSFALIGTAGAGLTNINLPNQTMDIIGNVTGNISGSVGSVTSGVTVTTNNDKTGYTASTVTDKTGYSLTQAFPTNFADLAITVTTGQVTASNMRGTDNALLAASYTAPDNASITAILADTNELQLNQGNWLTATGFSTLVATDIVSGGAITTSGGAVSNVTTVATTTTNTDMVAAAPTVSQILTTQMTESYPANGVAPTLAQSLFLTMQNLQNFSFAGTTQTVKKLDGTTTAATYTLDSDTAPTTKTRAT